MHIKSFYSVKEAKEGKTAAELLFGPHGYEMGVVGTWKDAGGELLFFDYQPADVVKLHNQFVTVRCADGEVIKVKPDRDARFDLSARLY